ncbi:hypothetical protein GCM10012320_18840 [Sinomonas cellulolyticus]|uniref:DUF2853 family protein n=1 Tax=Sinomonas cellulolyticus TaxID=2801916 RepID=A0ABS1K8P7_9MICC|nr:MULTISPECIES: DUF2853 family protein [Sinomonas]MBL0707262.1 DUF2853 family protein [Sinomonas cellulolyticus]GHG50306.1 hypothetical protein GCM10012320_18840 [Sinomonas sp. KCTC 49339]
MAVDWAEQIKKLAPNADDEVVAGVIRHCGIALQSADASLVSFGDKTETDRVRDGFLKKKLGRTEDDATLDAAIQSVGQKFKGINRRQRPTVYYLLAEHFDQLDDFRKKSK